MIESGAVQPDYSRYHYFYGRHRLEDFLYGDDAPWPQPAPDHPVGQMAQVLHVPRAEQREWKRKVARNYVYLLLTRWPAGLWYAWRHPHQRALDDEAFSHYLGEGLYSKFLSPLDPPDEQAFEKQMQGAGPETVFYKSDFSPMAELAGETNPGTHVCPTVVLLRRDGDAPAPARAVAIRLLDSDTVLTPEDDNRHGWNLARYFALQGAAHRINLIDHAVVHFPSDPVNAITKTLLPKHHPLLKLLLPHFRLSLPVNNSVLEGAESLINRTRWVIYSPFTAPGRVIRRLLPWGYVGHPENSSYPAYRFRPRPAFPPSLYGEFLSAYHQTIRRHVAALLAPVRQAPPGSDVQALVSLWADHVAAWLPGFPDGAAIWAEETLEDTVATVIWNVSVAHAADHETLHRMPSDEIPFRIRVPPPTGPDAPAVDTARLNRRFDVFQAWLTDELFYKPHNHSLLQDVDYGFDEPALQRENAAFRDALRQTEARLADQARVPIFAPLERIAASIQY